MKQLEALCQYYNSHGVQIVKNCHPLTPTAKEVVGITPLESNLTSVMRPNAHAAVVFEEGRSIYNMLNMNILTKSVFGFPGGGIEGNETPEQCVQREILEELGYESWQYQLTTLGYLVAGISHVPLFLVDVTNQIPIANEITGSTHIAMFLLEELYKELPRSSQSQVRSTINSKLVSLR